MVHKLLFLSAALLSTMALPGFAQHPSVKIMKNQKAVLTSSIMKSTGAGMRKAAGVKVNYERPTGYLYAGISANFKDLTDGNQIILGAPYANALWLNTSTAAQTIWTYDDPQTGASATAQDKDLGVNYAPGTYTMPALSATTDTGKVNFALPGKLQIGGDCGIYGVSALNPNLQLNLSHNFFGWTAFAKYVWATIFNSFSLTEVEGLGNYIEAPASPYLMTQVRAIATMDCYVPTFKLKAEVYKASKDSRYSGGFDPLKQCADTALLRKELHVGDLIASATCTEADTTHYVDSNNGLTWVNLTFKFKDSQGKDTTLVIDSSVIVKISGFAESGIQNYWSFYQDFEGVDTKECPGYFFLQQTPTGATGISHNIYPTSILSMGSDGTHYYTAYSAFTIYTDAKFPWMHSDDYAFNAASEGGSKEFSVSSNYAPKDWNVSVPAEATWLKYATAETPNGGTITFTADALPANAEGRQCNVVVSAPGASATYTISQGKVVTAISQCSADAAIRTATRANAIDLTYPDGISAVDIYNVSGQQIGRVSLQGNSSSISTADWNKGVYVLKFSNGNSVKVAR
jgi:hypothetical protein